MTIALELPLLLRESPNALETKAARRGHLQEVSNGTEDTGKSSTGTSDVVDGSVGGDLEWASLGDGSRWGVDWLAWGVDWSSWVGLLWCVRWLDWDNWGLGLLALNDPGGGRGSRVGLAVVGEGGWALLSLLVDGS